MISSFILHMTYLYNFVCCKIYANFILYLFDIVQDFLIIGAYMLNIV